MSEPSELRRVLEKLITFAWNRNSIAVYEIDGARDGLADLEARLAERESFLRQCEQLCQQRKTIQIRESGMEAMPYTVQVADHIDNSEHHVLDLEARLAEYEQLFRMQHERTFKADRLWQEEHNMPTVVPDLGKLIDWLLERLAALQHIVRWDSGDTTTCWHRGEDVRITYLGNRCPLCETVARLAAATAERAWIRAKPREDGDE
jgi:hypothetical protein